MQPKASYCIIHKKRAGFHKSAQSIKQIKILRKSDMKKLKIRCYNIYLSLSLYQIVFVILREISEIQVTIFK